jgi:catechol 2,3-dioxygenase
MMGVAVAKLGHIGVTVKDMDRTVDFYTKLIGLRLTESFDYGPQKVGHGSAVRAGAFVRCDSTHHCISFFTLRESGPESDVPGLGLHHIAFEMTTSEELVDMYRQLKAAGVEIVSMRQGGPGNQPRFYAKDPDGNLLEFYWNIDMIGWDGVAREYPPIEEVDLEEYDFEKFVALREQAAAEQSGQSA